jgi:integrase
MEKSLGGEVFDLHSDEWKLSARVTLGVAQLRALVAPTLLEGLIMTLCYYARNRTPATCKFVRQSLKNYANCMSPNQTIASWRPVDIQNYRELLNRRFGEEQYLIQLRSFLKTWYVLRYPGVDRRVFEALKEMVLKKKDAGRAVRSMDPNQGPLEPSEQNTLIRGIQSAYEHGSLDLQDFALCLFHIATGRRPGQSASLKCKDLDNTRATTSDMVTLGGNTRKAVANNLLLMHVPRGKQHGATFRDEFRSIQWTPEFFAVFRMQQRSTQLELERLLEKHGWVLQQQDLVTLQADLPLFPDWKCILVSLKVLTTLRQEGRHGQALQDLRAAAEGAQWHRSHPNITRILRTSTLAAGSLSTMSKPLSITALRLRHTKGTDLAREGLGRDIIAWLLDHSTLESVKIYTDNLPEHAIPANAAMALSPTMQKLAQLFRGKVVDKEEDALAGKDPRASRIHFEGMATATCGSRKQCDMGTRIPLCCYECDHFQPWLEGPHLDVLTKMLAERRQREATLGKKHPVVSAVDSTIVAVINVIQRCEARRQELRDYEMTEGVTPKKRSINTKVLS